MPLVAAAAPPQYDLSRNPNLAHIHFHLSCGRSWHTIANDLYCTLHNIVASLNSSALITEVGACLSGYYAPQHLLTISF